MSLNRRPRNYWSLETIASEVQPIAQELGHFPTTAELIARNLGALNKAIVDNGGFYDIKKKLGYQNDRIKMGFWTDFQNVKAKMQELEKKLGHVPSSSDLESLGETGLLAAITNYHGGFRKVRAALGHAYTTKEFGFWKEWSNVQTQLQKIESELGHFPSGYELTKLGHKTLHGAIVKYHGGHIAIRERLGKPPLESKPEGFWQDWNNVRPVLDEIIQATGDFPTLKVLGEFGYSSVGAALCAHHGGIQTVREKMGFTNDSKPVNYWKLWRNLKKEISAVIKARGDFPTRNELLDLGRHDLISAMQNHHGGLSAVRARMGYDEVCKPKGFWTDWNNVAPILSELQQKLGRIPSGSDLRREGYESVLNAILSHHGGMKTVREKLGHVYTEPAMKKFKDFDEVKKVLDDLETRLGRFPTQKDIAAEKIVGFVSAVADYHGGLLKIAKKLGKPLTQQERGHWTLERTVALYKEFVQEYKHSPTNDELTNRTDKYAGLMSGINRYGRKKICEEAQLSMTKKANGYWTEERMLQTGREIVAKYGRLPLQKELAKSEYSDFLGAVANSIGLTKLRELLGLKIEKAGAGWWTKERILQEVKKIIAQNGDLPTKDELAHMGLQNLAGQIEANGGYPYFRKLAGLEYRQLPKGTWQKEEYAMEQAHKCMVELGRTELPSYGMMTKAKYTSLVQSIQKYHGGIVAFREKFNARFNISKPVGLEQVLSEYVA